MKKFLLLALSVLFFLGCSSPNVLVGALNYQDCGSCRGINSKCVSSKKIDNITVEYDGDLCGMKGKEVRAVGEYVLETVSVDCETDYFDGNQHPWNERCENGEKKYDYPSKYFKVTSITLVE